MAPPKILAELYVEEPRRFAAESARSVSRQVLLRYISKSGCGVKWEPIAIDDAIELATQCRGFVIV
jgi:hypothetical protein